MSKGLEKIESRIQKLIEGAGKLLSASSPAESFSQLIVRCMRENAAPDASGLLTAPERYLVEVSPAGSSRPAFDPNEMDQIISELTQAATDLGILQNGKPEIIVRANPKLAAGAIKISASRKVIQRGSTDSIQILEEPELAINIPHGAFLIINGVDTVQLLKPVINIGRRTSNDIVLDDPKISRNHAQLRSIKSGYVIFDLNSRGGTYVNNLPVTQKELYPGDVISLAGVPIIYGQDSGGAIYEPGEQTPTSQLLSKKPEGKK